MFNKNFTKYHKSSWVIATNIIDRFSSSEKGIPETLYRLF